MEELEDDADLAAAPLGELVLAQRVHRLAQDDHFAGGGAVDAGDHVEQGRFAAARGPTMATNSPARTWSETFLRIVKFTAADGKALDDVAEIDDGI